MAGRSSPPSARRSTADTESSDATIKWAGDWRRAYDYGDPEGEALAVNRAAGLIDVSTLGKLLVRGPDAGDFLDRLYPNRFSNLKPGRIRYGVISSDAGRIVDDGTICRIDDETFYVTTTSSGAGAVEEWFSWWLADWGLDVQLTDLTQGLSAVNLAGPKAREIMALVTDLDCSNEAFTYLDGKQGLIAGVQCLILRIGFVGEVGYEIHFPAAYGEHLWDALMKAGEPHGLRPFGLEPQRILRLQKMHILVGQDTDSESTPFGAAMSWIVKLDKEQDWIGKWALEHYQESAPTTELVGFSLANGYVPTEGAVVVDEQGVPAGQVTSARHSPVLGRTIGMAWVPNAVAKDGAKITISDEGGRPRPRFRPSPSTTPTARCCAREPGLPVARRRRTRALRRRRSRARRWRRARRTTARDSMSATAGTSPSTTEPAPVAETVGWADMSHIDKLELQGAGEAIDAAAGFAAPVRDGRAPGRRLVVPVDGDPGARRRRASSSVDPRTADGRGRRQRRRRDDATSPRSRSSGRWRERCSRASARSICGPRSPRSARCVQGRWPASRGS